MRVNVESACGCRCVHLTVWGGGVVQGGEILTKLDTKRVAENRGSMQSTRCTRDANMWHAGAEGENDYL